LKDKKSRIEYFFATAVNSEEFNDKLCAGWRRFGYFFFRPNCEVCFACIPIRIDVSALTPSRSQRRIIRKNTDTKVNFTNLRYTEEIFSIYKEHSWDRFQQDTTKEHFVESFYTNAVPALQSEYYIEGELAAVGFIDMSSEAMSSVYFFYKTKFRGYSLGTFSVLRESEFALSLGKKFYYLGYYISENHSMQYKNQFKPYQLFNWHIQNWEDY